MTRRLRRIARLALLALIAATAAAASPSSDAARGASSPERAIVQFSGSPSRIGDSFHALHTHYLARAGALRSAALKHLRDKRPDVHYASLYALALTADAGPAAAALRRLLSSKQVDERMLAASALARTGDKAAIPVLIEGLSVRRQLAYRDPPEQAWELARHALLSYTTQDFGLHSAGTASAASRVQPAWRRWWKARAPSLRWKPGMRRFSGLSEPAIATVPGANPGTRWEISGSDVTITVPIDVVGPAIVHDANGKTVRLSTHARTQLENAARIWNNALKQLSYSRDCGGLRGQPWHFTVKLDVGIHSPSYRVPRGRHKVTFVDDPALRSTFRSIGKHVGKHTDDKVSTYGSGREGTWSTHIDDQGAAHELGHLLGLGDDYEDEIVNGRKRSVPIKRGGSLRDGTMMADKGKIDQQLADRLGGLVEQASGKQPTCRPVGVVTFTRNANLTEEFNRASLQLSVEGRSAPNGGTLTVNIGYEGTLTCASPGPCSACPGTVLTETVRGSTTQNVQAPFELSRLANRIIGFELRPGTVRVTRKEDQFTNVGCATATVETTEVWTIAPPEAGDLRAAGARIPGSGEASRNLTAPPGGHVCSLVPNHGQAFTTCQETLRWNVS
jgi:hypothetical protein